MLPSHYRTLSLDGEKAPIVLVFTVVSPGYTDRLRSPDLTSNNCHSS